MVVNFYQRVKNRALSRRIYQRNRMAMLKQEFGRGEIHRLRNNKNPFFKMERCRVICTRNFPSRKYSFSRERERKREKERTFRILKQIFVLEWDTVILFDRNTLKYFQVGRFKTMTLRLYSIFSGNSKLMTIFGIIYYSP